MKAKFIFILCVTLMLSSCSTIKKTSDTAEINTPVSTYPTVADLNVVPQRVSKTVTWKWNPLNSISLSTRQANATAELILETGADVLLEPQYITTTSWLNILGGSLTVTGYPASFENFRKATPADLEALRAVRTVDGKCHDKCEKEKKKFWIF